MRKAQLLSIFLVFAATLTAQPGSMTQAEVNAEKAFIEAKQDILLGNLDEALVKFEEMAKADAENDVLHYEIGRIYYVKEDNTAAERALEKAYKLNPSVAYAGLLSNVYQATGQYKKGAELYGNLANDLSRGATRSSNAGDGYEQLRLQQALFLVKAQEIDKAIGIYNDLQKKIGVTADLSRKKHALYLGKGDHKKAEKELVQLIEAFPRELEYRHLLAGFYNSQNESKKAADVYRAILQLEPADVKAQLALDSNDKVISKPGGDAKLMSLMSQTDVNLDLKIGKLLPMIQVIANTKDQKMAEEAMPLVKEMVRVHPTEAKPLAILGDLYFYSGQIDKAAETYHKTIELDDTVYPVWEQYLHALYLGNQMKKLRSAAEDALDVFPNRPFVSFYYALGEAGRGDFAEAVSLLDQAIFIFNAAGQEQAKMARIYQNIINELKDGNLPATNPLPIDEGPMSQYLQARKYFDNGSFNQALEILQEADSDRNTNGLLLELLGDTMLKSNGDKTAAALIYERAKKAGSSSKSLNKKILDNKS